MNGWLGRWLLVRDDERATVLHFLILALLLGAGLALGRGSAETLFFKRYGIEHLPVMYALLGGLLAVSSLAYAVWADRLAGERLTVIMLATLAALLAVSWARCRTRNTTRCSSTTNGGEEKKYSNHRSSPNRASPCPPACCSAAAPTSGACMPVT